MSEKIVKMVVIPLDGSGKSLQAIDYLDAVFGSKHNLQVALLYVMPSLPPFLVENRMRDMEIAKEFKAVKEENARVAAEVLERGKKILLEKGYPEENIRQARGAEQLGFAHDICKWAETEQVDAILLRSRGLTRVEGFFMGQVTIKLLECCHICPIWVMRGEVRNDAVLIPVDASESCFRAADHAGFMLSGTDRKITLFHSKQALDRFVPKSLLASIPQLRARWSSASGEKIMPYMKKVREILLYAGILEENITEKIIDGGSRADKDILKEADGYGTIVFGRQAPSCNRDFALGSIAIRVLENVSDTAIWVV